MPDSSADRDPLDRLAEEFVARLRAGERPAITEYATRLPDRADEVRDLFPALVEMEHLKPASADRTGAFVPEADPHHPARVVEFRILRQVGHGGMGVVYEALQESLGRHVALKLLPPEAVADPKRLERFRREAKAAARLHHTNIVPVFGTGTADGRHYYAMQFIAGHPLDAVIDEVRRLKDKSAAAPPARAVSEVAAALLTNTFAAGGGSGLGVSPLPQRFVGGEVGDASSPGEGVLSFNPGDADPRGLEVVPPYPPRSAATSPPQSRGRGEAPSQQPASPASLSDGGAGYFGTVARLGAQAADALAYAHAQGILHRDIKPANLLLDLQGTLWITDFGLAKSSDTDDLTHAGDIVGTLRYMAPERFDGSGDARSDVYALGLTLYELLTLTPAFAADTRAKLVEQVLAASPPKPRSINPAIPRDLETIVLKAIARDPAMRFPTATELADELRRYTEDRPILSRRASSAEQAYRWCRRNPAVASLITAVLLVSVIGATVASLIARQQRRTANELAHTLGEKEKTAAELEHALGQQRAMGVELDLSLKFTEERRRELVRQGDFTRRLLYVSHVNAAQTALADGRIPRMVELLAETTPKPGEPDLRNWEWNYLRRLLQPDRVISLANPDDPPEPPPSDSLRQLNPAERLVHARAYPNVVFCPTGERAFIVRPVDWDNWFIEVKESLSGKTVARVPKAGSITRPEKAPAERYWSGPQLTMSPDGRSVVVELNRDGNYGPESTSQTLTQFWDVDKGEPIPVPDEFLKRFVTSGRASGPRTVGIGPGGAWISVLSWKQSSSGPSNQIPGVLTGPVDVECHRWDRATGRVTTLAFPIGKEHGSPCLTPDGATVYWSAAVGYRPELAAGSPKQGLADRVPRPWFECWDVTGERAKSRFEPFRVARPAVEGYTGQPYFSPYLSFSPTGTVAAFRATGNEVAVYRVADGAELPPIKLQGDVGRDVQFGAGRGDTVNLSISDAGTRVVIRDLFAMYVAGPNESRKGTAQPVTSTWRIPMNDPVGPGRFRSSATTYFHVDGVTAIEYSTYPPEVRAWDVSRDPSVPVLDGKTSADPDDSPFNQAAGVVTRDGKRFRTATTTDGRVTLEWPFPEGGPKKQGGGFEPARYPGPVVVRDVEGRELGTLPDVPEFTQLAVNSLGEGRRFFVNFTLPPLTAKKLTTSGGGGLGGGSPNLGPPAWRLYELADGRVAEIDRAAGMFVMRPDGALVEVPGLNGGRRTLNFPRPVMPVVVLRDAGTGNVVRPIRIPGRLVQFCGYDPTRRTYLVQSINVDTAALPFPPRLRTGVMAVTGTAFAPLFSTPRPFDESRMYPLRVHLFDAATGDERWHVDIAPTSYSRTVTPAAFSPDGTRVLLRYWGSAGEPPQLPPEGMFQKHTPDRLWVARAADGTVERDVLLDKRPQVRYGGPSAASPTVAHAPDGRHVAVPCTGEVQVWDLVDGKLRHTLKGHTGVPSENIRPVYNADGSRLVTTDSSAVNGLNTTGRPQTLVWDTATGREVLSIPTPEDYRGVQRPVFVGDKLLLRTGIGVRTLDGTPLPGGK